LHSAAAPAAAEAAVVALAPAAAVATTAAAWVAIVQIARAAFCKEDSISTLKLHHT